MDRTSPNELKMSTGKVQAEHWRRGDKNVTKNNGRIVKHWKRFHQERALKKHLLIKDRSHLWGRDS